jgi:nucleoid DNA-binding protein
MTETLASAEEVKIYGITKFAVHLKYDRSGRNSQTG